METVDGFNHIIGVGRVETLEQRDIRQKTTEKVNVDEKKPNSNLIMIGL